MQSSDAFKNETCWYGFFLYKRNDAKRRSKCEIYSFKRIDRRHYDKAIEYLKIPRIEEQANYFSKGMKLWENAKQSDHS